MVCLSLECKLCKTRYSVSRAQCAKTHSWSSQMSVRIEWICAFLILNPSLSHIERKLKEGIKEEGKDFIDQISNLMEDLGKAGDMLGAPQVFLPGPVLRAVCHLVRSPILMHITRFCNYSPLPKLGFSSLMSSPPPLLPPPRLPPSFPSHLPPPPSLLHLPLPLLLLWKWVLVD